MNHKQRILYCFISHQAVIEKDAEAITAMCDKLNIEDFLIVCGGSQHRVEGKVHYLNCDDTYEGLPNKIHTMFRYLTINFSHYNIFVKLDRLTRIIKPIDVVIRDDYSGNLLLPAPEALCRDYHFGKCSKDSIWNSKLYEGPYVPWCSGPHYMLSNFAARIVSLHPPNPEEEIFEDLYVGKTLFRAGILARRFNWVPYFVDSEWSLYSGQKSVGGEDVDSNSI